MISTFADILAIEKEMPVEQRWSEKTVYQKLCTTRDKHPDRPAVSFQLKSGPKDKATTLSWAQFTERVTQAANLFRSLGVAEDDVVAFLLPSTHETAITLMAGMTAGIVAPINPTLKHEQIAGLLKETGAKVLVTLKSFPKSDLAQVAAEAISKAPSVKTVIEIDLLPHLDGLASWIVPLIRPRLTVAHSAEVIDFDAALATQEHQRLNFDEAPDDRICAYFHTGGTTGMPKVTQHRFSGVLYNGWVGCEMLFEPEDVILCPLPLFHVLAAYPIWMGCVFTGAHLVLPTPAGYRGEGVIDNFWKLVERWKATFVVAVPTAAAALLQRPVDADISSLKSAFSGSAPLPVEVFNRFEKITGVEIIEGYGMTETTCVISVNPPDGERRIGSVGFPFPYTDIRILDCAEDGSVKRACGVDEVGEICVSNPGVVIGATYTDPEKNKTLFAEGVYLRTGDLGRIDADGYLWITGRAKDLIIRGGHNIDPAVIEEAMVRHPAVAFAGAIGQPDPHSGEVPCVYLELQKDASVEIADLQAFAKEAIGERAAIPKHIEIIDKLPKTAIGKIFKPELRKMAITRVYNEALAASGLSAKVVEVVEDRQRGLVAKLSRLDASVTDDQVTEVLGAFVRPWDWAE
jgi:acyl-CoA synthetase (AMP-forming)/AMP-acid ligase II